MSEPDARFTLANERTFLAWIRTALGLMAGGIAAAYVLEDVPDAVRLAVALGLLGFGAFTAHAGYARWRAGDEALRTGRPLPDSKLPRVLVTGVVAVALAGALSLLAAELW